MLFRSEDTRVKKPDEGFDGDIMVIDDTIEPIFFKAKDVLKNKLPELQSKKTYPFVAAGNWSVHDLIFHLLETTGPADLYISTWTATESPVRMLLNGLQSGLIKRLELLFDMRVPHRTPEMFQLARHSASRVGLDRCHAKCFSLINDKHAISFMGSANLTNNPRIEVGVIFTNPIVAEFNRKWICQVLDGAKPFDNDFYY